MFQNESIHIRAQKNRHFEKLKKFNPTFFCMNDTEYADDNDRMKLKVWLSTRFPEKSSLRSKGILKICKSMCGTQYILQ